MIDKMNDTAEYQAHILRLKQAHAMLNLFETDCKRAAATLEEIKEWAYAQEDE
jgi:prefoldin subunit 5